VEVVNNNLILLILIASGLLILVCLGLIFMLSKRLSSNQQNIHHLKHALKESRDQTAILRSEIAEVRSSLMNMGKRIVACENYVKELAQQQAAQKYDDPDAKIYSRAVKMIELGADLEEIMKECELPRAEAELLMSLHQKS
jgi:septal ring factor EnvC (AmiA/AmiB activator)